MEQIHPTAIIAAGARLAPDVRVGPYCVIGPEVAVGEGTVIASHVVITGRTAIGRHNRIFQFASVGDGIRSGAGRTRTRPRSPARGDGSDRGTER